MLDVTFGATDKPSEQSLPGDDPPRRLLMLAVIDRAVQDAKGRVLRPDGNSTERNIHAKARRWLFNDDERPQSFAWYCLQLGYDREWMRENLVAQYGDRITEGTQYGQ